MLKSWREAKLEEQTLAKMIAEHKAEDLDAYLSTRNSNRLLSPELIKAAFREFLNSDVNTMHNSPYSPTAALR